MKKYLQSIFLLLLLLPFLLSFTWNGGVISTWNGKTLATWNGATVSSCVATLSSSFTAVTGATVSTAYESNTPTITLSEACGATEAISISGGEYKINSGSYTSSSGTVADGDTVTVRQTSSSSNYTETTATLTIAGGANDYDVTTILGVPTGVAATAGDTQVSVAYTGATGASTYNGYYGTSSGACSGKTKVTGIGASPWVLTGLTNGTAYYFNVSNVDSNSNESACSSEVTATPHPAPEYQFGSTTITGSTVGETGYAYWVMAQSTSTKTITSIKVYAVASGHVKVALYSDSAGSPGTRLAKQDTSVAVTGGQWNNIDLETPYQVSSAYYWIAVAVDTGSMLKSSSAGNNAKHLNLLFHGEYSGFTWPSSPPTLSDKSNTTYALTAWGY